MNREATHILLVASATAALASLFGSISSVMVFLALNRFYKRHRLGWSDSLILLPSSVFSALAATIAPLTMEHFFVDSIHEKDIQSYNHALELTVMVAVVIGCYVGRQWERAKLTQLCRSPVGIGCSLIAVLIAIRPTLFVSVHEYDPTRPAITGICAGILRIIHVCVWVIALSTLHPKQIS